MSRMRTQAWAGQGFRFVLVGLAQVVVDWAAYVALTWAGMDTAWANPVARACGMALGFWLHGAYTFADGHGARWEPGRAWRFAATWGVLTAIGTVGLRQLVASYGLEAAWLAKPLVEGVLALVAFFLWRHVVYR